MKTLQVSENLQKAVSEIWPSVNLFHAGSIGFALEVANQIDNSHHMTHEISLVSSEHDEMNQIQVC